MSESYTVDSIIPEDLFGRDHFSTLAYIETRLVDGKKYVICCDARMRTDAHNRRIFMHRPGKQISNPNRYMVAMIGRPASPTRLRDGIEVPQHDDWDCIQDMAKAGYIVGDALRYPFRGMPRPTGVGSAAARKELADFYRLQIDPTGVDLGARIKLTPRGYAVVAALRQHQAEGGTFATFRPPSAMA